MRFQRQLYLIGEHVVRIPPRVIAGAPCPALRVSVSARNEDLATIADIGPFSALRGTLDLVDLPVDAIRDAKAMITLGSADGDPSNAFHVDIPRARGAGVPARQLGISG